MRYIVTCGCCGASFGCVPGATVQEGPQKGKEIVSVNCIICQKPVVIDSGRWQPGPMKIQVEEPVDLLRL